MFTGRDDECTIFSEAIAADRADEPYKVLMWYGVGGQGKSSLLREFVRLAGLFNEDKKNENSTERLVTAKIDLDDERLQRIDSALYSIRLQLAQIPSLHFYAFDTAFVAYYKKTRPGIDIAATFPELFGSEKESLVDLINVLEGPASLLTELAAATVPGASLLYKWGARVRGKLKAWWDTRGKEIIVGIDSMQPDELLQQLPSFLGADICDGIKVNPNIRPLIILDTYEAIWQVQGQRDALINRRNDAWVRLLVQDAPGVLFVIAGRDRLRWPDIDKDWDKVVTTRRLEGLSNNEAEQFLLEVPINDESIRKEIIESSEGLPFFINLQVSHFENLADQDIYPTIKQFGGTPSDVLSRFLDHLNDSDLGILRLASYLHTVTKPTINYLVETFPGRTANYSFETMVARSSYTETSEGTYEIHALMREELQRKELKEDEDHYRRVHRSLFEFYENLMHKLNSPKEVVDGVLSFKSAYLHLENSDKILATNWLLKNRNYLELRSADTELIELYKTTTSIAITDCQLPISTRCAIENNLAISLMTIGLNNEANLIFDRVDKQIDYNSPLLGIVYLNRGALAISQKDHSLAASQFKNAILTFKNHGSHHGSLISFSEANLAELRYLDGKFKEAKMLVFTSINRLPGVGKMKLPSPDHLYLLSRIYHCTDQPELAISLYQISVRLKFGMVDNKTDADINEKVEESPTFDDFVISNQSSVQDGILEKEIFNFFPRLFASSERENIFTEIKPSFSTADAEKLRAFLETYKESDTDHSNFALKKHQNSELFLSETRRTLSSCQIGRLLLAVVENGNLKIEFYESNHPLDFGYVHETKLIWITMSREITLIGPIEILAIVFSIRSADHELMGFSAPSSTGDMVEWATVHHGKYLDRFKYVMSFISQLEETVKTKYLEVLSGKAYVLYELIINEASPEILFDCYAEIAWSEEENKRKSR